MKKETKIFKDEAKRCWFLLAMSFVNTIFLALLNIYIGYNILQSFKGDGFSFLGGLFIAFSFIFTIPALIFSGLSIVEIKNNSDKKYITPIVLGIIGLIVGIILHNATQLWIYIVFLNVLLLVSYFVCNKKTKTDNSNVPTLILAITLTISLSGFPTSLSAQENNKIQEIFLRDKNDFDEYVEYYSSNITNLFDENNKYSSSNLFDGYLKTCWVSGSSKQDTCAELYINLPSQIELDKLILNIFSGYGKSKSLFYANARPKQIKLSLFAAIYPEGFSTEVGSLYLINKLPIDTIFELADTFRVQSFYLNFDKNTLLDFQKKTIDECRTFSGENYNYAGNDKHPTFTPSFILKIEIVDVYKGIKYDDICISEIFFNDRFITSYPDKYAEILNVYVKNDNTLLANYKEQKEVVIFKDTSSVFTMIDWIEKGNFAILHYVRNDEIGVDSRIEELYSLIDLKNRTIVDKELKKCTGISPMFQFLKKDKNGEIFIDNNGEYKIKLR